MVWLFAFLGAVVPVLCWASVWMGFDAWVAGDVAGIAILIAIAGTLLTAKEQLILRWCYVSTLAHVGWELPWVLLSKWLQGVTEHDKWAFLFWTYGTADSRYLTRDPGIFGIETLTSFIVAPIVVYVIVLLRRGDTRKAHLLLLMASCCQLYGAVLYFLEEAMRGFAGFSGEPIDLYVKVIGLNGVWLVMPVVLIKKLWPSVYAR